MAEDQLQVLSLFKRPYDTPAAQPADSAIVYPGEESISTRFGGSLPPDRLTQARSIPRGSIFSVFSRAHRRAAKELCDFFMQSRNVSQLVQAAAAVRGTVNESLYIFALSFTIIRKPEMRSVRLPSIVEVFPTMFVTTIVIAQMEKAAKTSQPGQDMVITEFGPEFSSTHLKPEHRVSYFREDYGINAHHWHWHIVFPVGMGVERDRKGELFYYMHEQMLARYDMARLSVGLNRVEKLSNWRQPIEDGYFPKLTVDNAGRSWGSRQDNTLMQDYRRNDDFGLDKIDVSDLELTHSRVMGAIHQGYFVDREGNRVPLSDDVPLPNKRGIDLLGDAFEADSDLSVNYPFYGDIHNFGHIVISGSHDPDYAHKEELGVMSDTATAMRDPSFYRWHKYVDSVFQEYKLTQRPYTEEELSLPGVEMQGVEVESGGQKNNLTTGWKTRDFEASRGLDFSSNTPVMVRITHLDHRPFTYHIKLNNNGSQQKEVTVRIFMAPKLNERGVEMGFMEQRLLWAEMDRFTTTLKPGNNQVHRNSVSSSITNPNEFTFRELEQGAGGEDLNSFCGCGWPQHMLVPRGKQEGMTYQLFVMITDWAKDKVTQPPGSRKCANAASFCGILDANYPDSRPMGFPFDRRPPATLLGKDVTQAADFTRLRNILMQDLTVTFTNTVMTV